MINSLNPPKSLNAIYLQARCRKNSCECALQPSTSYAIRSPTTLCPDRRQSRENHRHDKNLVLTAFSSPLTSRIWEAHR
eukprot:6190732-Pleurochrysis_carterae.AAC.3